MTPGSQSTPENETAGTGMGGPPATDRTGDEALSDTGTGGKGSPIELSDRAKMRFYDSLGTLAKVIVYLFFPIGMAIFGYYVYRVIEPLAEVKAEVRTLNKSIERIERKIERLEDKIFLGESMPEDDSSEKKGE